VEPIDASVESILDSATFAEVVRRWEESQTSQALDWQILMFCVLTIAGIILTQFI